MTLSLEIVFDESDQSYNYDDFDDQYSEDHTAKENVDFNLEDENENPWLTANHARRGDIKVELESPNGTISVLLPFRKFDYINAEGYDHWQFMSVHYWGETPTGTWKFKVTYNNSHAKVYARIHNFKIYGTSEVPQAVSQIPENCDPACARGCAAAGADYCDSCADLRDQLTFVCMSNNQTEECVEQYNGYCLRNSLH